MLCTRPWTDVITIDKRELRLIKTRMSHHSWNDLLVGISCKNDEELAKKFKMTIEELEEFKRKTGIK
jgi:hypothetical protein